MKTLKKIGKVLAVILLVLVLFYQVMGIWGVALSQVTAIKEATWLIPIWAVMVALLLIGLILYRVWKGKEYLPLVTLVISLIGAGLALVVALTLQAALPTQVAATNISQSGLQGLDAWKLITRHYSPVAVGVVLAVLSFLQHKQANENRVRKENDSYEEQFADEDNPLLSPAPAAKPANKKLSKKQRKALKEKENGGN